LQFAGVSTKSVLWVAAPHLQTYRGLSGIDAALFMCLAATHLRPALRARHCGWVAALAGVCLAFLAKVSYEVVTGATLFVNSQAGHMVPVPVRRHLPTPTQRSVARAKEPPSSGWRCRPRALAGL
jgi:hypothetical protein